MRRLAEHELIMAEIEADMQKFFVITHDDPPRRIFFEAENIKQANAKVRAMGLKGYTIAERKDNSQRSGK